MTSEEIFQKNREMRKGTFMDRTWKDEITKKTEDMFNPDLRFKDKFWMGYYTYHAFSARFTAKLKKSSDKVEFLEDLFANKDKYAERD